MAEGGQLSLISFKKQFDDQITCNVCLDQYTNPKTLPCHHSFCLHCIEQLPVEIKDGKYYISCPKCRVDHLLPQGGANSLPNDFKINSLLDLRKKLLTTEIAILAQSTCRQHNDLLTVYCETCCQVICRDCTISTEHNKHTFYLISECYPKHYQQVLGNLDLVKHKLADMNTAMTHLDTREREVVEQGQNVKEQINAHAQQLIDNIQRSRTHLTQQVDTIVQQKTQTLAAQRQQAQKLHTQLKTCQDMIEHSLKEWNQQQILAQKITMMDEMKTTTGHVDPAVFQPIEDANIQFTHTEKEMGSIAGVAYGKATLEVSPCTTASKQPSLSANLTLHSQDGSFFSLPPSLISCTLSSAGNKHSVKCPITEVRQKKHSMEYLCPSWQTQPVGKYRITLTPSTTKNQLIVQVGGVDVPDSPFTLPVMPEMRWEPINIMTGLNAPWGIAVCDNGDIVVAENGAHCVTFLSKNGEKVKKFEQFNCPRGVAVSMDGHILVTDDHRLQKITVDGVCVKSVGSSDSGCHQLQFNAPQGIAVHSTTGQIFVADHNNIRIQAFSNDLTFSHTIYPTYNVWQSHRFRSSVYPQDIAMDNEGYLYIVNDWAGRNFGILKVSGSTGESIETFSSTPDQKVINPSSLTIHNNLVYVSQYNNDSILVCDTDCEFQHLVTGSPLVFPWGMSSDIFGNLYISDYHENRIVVYMIMI